ncbi:unnamed protein product [Arabis nemorensis]|uniref:Uncharacterized protein n=1 Tax=Arabis nemorensis TaxID=586526 RepID=A0A565CS64_9BRAS|nr:unnamed protein product [Arabis nemorensis]
MVVSREISSGHMVYVADDVISKTRSDLVDNGELEETVLNQIEAIWKRKMIQAGVIIGTVDKSSPPIPAPRHLQTQDQNPLPEIADNARSMNLSMDPVDSVKRERDGFFIHQQDGANDEGQGRFRLLEDATLRDKSIV